LLRKSFFLCFGVLEQSIIRNSAIAQSQSKKKSLFGPLNMLIFKELPHFDFSILEFLGHNADCLTDVVKLSTFESSTTSTDPALKSAHFSIVINVL
jgi:hypothetical protein